MAFAIFYNDVDMDFVELWMRGNANQLTQADRQLALQYWNGGVKDWKNSPMAQSPYEQFIPTNTARRIVVSNGALLEFRQLLYRIAQQIPAASYLKALADDMGRNCGGVEPWPVI